MFAVVFSDCFLALIQNTLNWVSYSSFERYIVAAQALVDEARGSLGERGWRTRNGDAASYDDISVFVVPLYNHKDLKRYIKEEKNVPLHLREDSFVKKYVKRGEVELCTKGSGLNSDPGKVESSHCEGDAKLEKIAADAENADGSNNEVN